MTIAEHRRLELFAAAKESWGEETAQTMMDLLPPDASQLATRADLAQLRAELRADISQLEARLVRTMSDHTRLVVLAIVATTLSTVLAVVLA